LRVEGGAHRAVGVGHAGTAGRRHPRQRRPARIGGHAPLGPERGRRLLEAVARRRGRGRHGPAATPGAEPAEPHRDSPGAAEEGVVVQIELASVPPFYKNGYVVACEETGEAVIIDPGDEVDELLR